MKMAWTRISLRGPVGGHYLFSEYTSQSKDSFNSGKNLRLLNQLVSNHRPRAIFQRACDQARHVRDREADSLQVVSHGNARNGPWVRRRVENARVIAEGVARVIGIGGHPEGLRQTPGKNMGRAHH